MKNILFVGKLLAFPSPTSIQGTLTLVPRVVPRVSHEQVSLWCEIAFILFFRMQIFLESYCQGKNCNFIISYENKTVVLLVPV